MTIDQPTGLFNVIHAPLVVAYHAYFYALICVACHAYHTFLKTLYECMFIVICLMLDFAERNEALSTVEAPTSPFVKGKWHIKLLLFLTMRD